MLVLKASDMEVLIEDIIRFMTVVQPPNITTVKGNTPKLMPSIKRVLLAAQL